MANASEKLAASLNRCGNFAKAVPGNMEHFYGFIQEGFANAAPLDAKTLQLIIVAAGVARANEDTILQHTYMFIEAGGTREALVAGLTAVVMAGGGAAWGSAGLALEVFDELAAAKK